ncbi:hypothetical protein ON010_g11069 [Phytophthora cinnamomi]|nr:hypothetical protein ON010_g11069 [Phytophthora cinnamomi]
MRAPPPPTPTSVRGLPSFAAQPTSDPVSCVSLHRHSSIRAKPDNHGARRLPSAESNAANADGSPRYPPSCQTHGAAPAGAHGLRVRAALVHQERSGGCNAVEGAIEDASSSKRTARRRGDGLQGAAVRQDQHRLGLCTGS